MNGFELVGQVVVYGLVASIALFMSYFVWTYLAVVFIRCKIHAYHGAGVSEDFKQKSFWRLRVIWGILFIERKTNLSCMNCENIRSEDYHIDFSNSFFPKITIYN